MTLWTTMAEQQKNLTTVYSEFDDDIQFDLKQEAWSETVAQWSDSHPEYMEYME